MEEENNTIDVNPVTGRPITQDNQGNALVNPVTGRKLSAPVRGGGIRGLSMQRNVKLADPLEKYGKYGATLSPFLDLEEERAKRQSTAEKWGHGLTKATVTMGGAIAENTLGMLVGLGEAAVNWDETRFYDNSIGRLVDKANNYAQEALPNYYTKQEQNAQGLNALGYANFWADKAANGLGYSLGSIATIYLTGGTGFFGGLGKIANLGKISQAALTTANAVHKGAQVAKVISTGAKISSGLMAAAKVADIGMMMSWAESSVEAREVLNGTAERLKQEYATSKGINVNAIPKDVLEDIHDKSARAGNVTMGLNLAVLSATNLITFGAHLSPKFIPATKGPLSRLTLQKASGKVIDKLAADPRWLAIGKKYIAPALTGGASEGFQEASQFAISTGAELEATDPEYTGDMFKAIMKGYGETYNTKEGFDNTLVGVVVGMLTGGMGSVQTAINKGMTAEDVQVQKAMEFLNSDEQLKTFIQRGQNANDIAKHVANMNSALREKQRDSNGRFTGKVGNHKAYSDAQFKALRAEVLMHAQYGTMDTFLERLDMEKDKTEDEYFKDHGLEDELKGKFDKNEMIEGVKRKAQALQEIYDNVESKFPTTEPTRGAARLFMSNEAKAAEAERIADDGFYKQMLYENEAEIGDIDGRMDNIVRDINRLDPVQYEDPAKDAKQGRKRTDRTVKSGGLSGISAQSINEAFTDPTVAGVISIGEAIMPVPAEGVKAETIKNASEVLTRAIQANPAKRQELIQKFQDLIELAKQRNKATGALNNLNSSPETREAYVARETFRAEKAKQDKIDQKAREDIAETKTAQELRDSAGGFSHVSDAMSEEINAEIRKREESEAKIKQEAGMLSPTQLEEAIEQEEDSVRKSVFQEELREAKEAGRTKARIDAGEKIDLTEGEVKEDVVDLTEKTNEEIDQEMSDMVEEQGRKQKEHNEAVEKELQKEDEAREKEQGIDNSIDMDNPRVDFVLNAGDLAMNKDKGPGKYTIIVNDQNNPSKGRIQHDETLFKNNGVLLNREPLFRPGLEGKTATFELLDNGTTIAIKVGEDYIGHLRNDDFQQSVDYPYILKKLQNGEQVTAEITGRDFNNPNNMVNEQGERVEVSLKESFEKAEDKPLVAIVRGRTETNEAGKDITVKYLDYGEVDEEGNTIEFDDSTLDSNLYAKIEEGENKGTDKFRSGSAVLIVKQPDGRHRALLTSTRTIGQSLRATGEVKSLISNTDKDSESSIDAIKSIIGVGARFDVGRDDNGNNYILVQEAPGHPVYRMYSDQYVNSEDSDVKFDVGEYDRDRRFKLVRAGDPKQTDFVRALIDNNIKKARFQIDKAKVNQPGEFISPLSTTTYPSYIDYLSDPSFMTDPNNDVGPIAVNFKAMDKTFGTFYHDIGITMEYTEAAAEQVVEDTQEVIDEQLPEDPTPQEGPSIGEAVDLTTPTSESRGIAMQPVDAEIDQKIIEDIIISKEYKYLATEAEIEREDSGEKGLLTPITSENVKDALAKDKAWGGVILDNRRNVVGTIEPIINVGGLEFVGMQDLRNALTKNKNNFSKEELTAIENKITELTSQPTSEDVGFQGYKGGFENTGKGTPQGDGKDKAMREVAQGAIIELSKTTPSSSLTSLRTYPSLHEEGKSKWSVTNEAEAPSTIMLARNGSLKGIPLDQKTKNIIDSFHKEGSKFVVGDMPGVDSEFINYLQEIGAEFTIYHTGNTSRINIAKPTSKVINIYAGTGENADLSNFAPRQFKYKGLDYVSVEEAFQIAKKDYFNTSSIDPSDTTTTPEMLQAVVDKWVQDIFNAKSSAAKKKIGGKSIGVDFETYSWDQDSSNIMKDIIKESFTQDSNARAKLLATGNATLTHTQDKGKWGKEFPKILMEVREELRGTQPISEVEVVPEVIEGDPIETEPLPVTDTQVSALDRIGNSRVFEELRDIATAKALHSIQELTKQGKDIEASLLFGDPETDTEVGETEGSDSMIAKKFLRDSYSRDGQSITDEDFDSILNENIVPEGVDPVPPQGLPAKTAGNLQAGNYFREVYNNWYSTYDATGMEENRGMRADVLDRLEEFGYTVREKSGTKVIHSDEGVVYQRIYNKGRLEENPFKKISQKVKRLLGRIPIATDVQNSGIFGFKTFVPIADVYAALLGATYGSKNVTEMMEKLRKLPSSHAVGGVYKYITTFNDQQKALLFYNFGSLSLTEFIIIDPSTVNEITLEERGLRTYNANSQATVSAYKKKFIKEANSGMTVYDVETDKDTTIYSVSKDTAASIKDNWKKLEQKDKFSQEELSDTLADLLMDMGYTIAPSRAEARRRVRDVILNTDNNVSIRNILKGTQSQLAVLAGQLSVPGVKTKSIFDGENKTINTIINKFIAPFEAAPALSFNMGGKLIYPINARTEIDNLSSRINDGTQLTDINGKDGFSAPRQVGMAIKLLSQTNRFSKPFKFQDLALLKGEQDRTYTDLSQEDVMMVSMALFDNPQGVKNTSLIALTTQADRKRMTFHTFPKMTEAGLAAAGLTGSVERVIKHEILLDFHRAYKAQLYIDNAKKNGDPLIEGYHTKGWFKRMNLPGIEYSDKVAQEIYLHLETQAPLQPETIQALEKQVDTYLASAVGEIKSIYPGLEGMLKSKLGGDFLTRYDNSLDVFLKQYVTTDILGKKFSNQLLRNGTTNWTKDGRTFIKRANLVTTPGGVLHISTDGTYGANPIFSTATVKDLTPEDVNHIAEKYGKLIENALLRLGASQEAAARAGAEAVIKYKNTNGTDAQAFISIEHYRKIKQGQGEWSDVDEQVYREYMSEIPGLRRWDSTRSPLVPMKPQYDTLNIGEGSLSDINIPISDKNSYMILTDQLAEGRPVLTDLLARMESRNEYRDMPKINVINTESATKLGQIRPYTINQQGSNEGASQFSDLHVINLDTRGLRFPQEIGVKDETKTTLGKQPKKTQIANVDRNHQYTLNPGTTKSTPVRGEKMLNIYHNSIERKVINDLNALKKELGFVDDFFESNPDQIVDSKFIVTLRNRLLDMAKEKGLPENVVEALRLEIDQAGNVMMGLPLSYPAFQNTFDNLLFSTFRKAVYQQKVNGMEMVQFAEFGGFNENKNTNSELKFLDVHGDGSLIHAEIEIGENQLRALGIDLPVGVDLDTTNVSEENRRVLGYRIPNASKSFLVAFKIKRVIPSGHMTAVRVPSMLTTALGADFDIDKMFLMFPTQRKDGKGRIMPDYKSLAANPNQILDASFPADVVDNIILDVFEAVATDPIHAHEILDPEGIEDINAALEAIGQGKDQRGDVDIFSPMTHIKAAYDNMLSQSLRGIYANAIAGRNIVTSTGQEITGPVTVRVDGKSLNAVRQNAAFPDRFGITRATDHFIKQYLSAAVDSVKDPLQSAANDTAKTAPLTVYLLSIGATPQQVIKFLTHPHVRKVTDAMQQKDANNPKGAFYFGTNLKRENNTIANLNIYDDTNPKEIENTLIALYRGANALQSTYSAVAVDNIDGAGSVSAHQAFFDRIRAYKNEEVEVYGGAEFIEGVLEGNLYRYEAAYYNAMKSAMEVATRAGMITDQLSVESFKGTVRNLTGKNSLTKEEHRDLNTIISHHILTKKGSPLQESGYLSKGTLETVHLFNPAYPTQNIIASLSAMQQLPNVANLSIIRALTPHETQFNAESRFFKLEFNNTLGKTVSEQNKLQREWERMLNRPETFGYDAVTTKQIQQFATDLITNSISTTGFFSSPTSMFSILPSSVTKELGIGEYMAQETVKLATTGSYLNELKNSFVNDYGHYKLGKNHMFNYGKVETGAVLMVGGVPSNVLLPSQLTADTNKKKYARIVATDSFGNAYVYQRVETEGTFGEELLYSSYHRVSTKGRQGMLNEAGNSESILFPKPGARPDTIAPLKNNAQQSRDLDGVGGEERDSKRKIKKLKAAFAAAGIDVIVEEGSLPKGVKGQVKGDVVTFDPAQMTDDTAYHEFGHIIVDMLDEKQVKSFIAQVRKARPDLAAMVERAYAEQGLSEYEMGKEILVTAIGIEGAKLETKNPSWIRRIINKIMRAIGKLFGVRPDAAVILAEKMFAGELRDLSLSGVFNEKVQRSRDLQEEVNTLYKNASISIQGEIRSLEMVPDGIRDQSQIRRLKELQKNIKRLTENKNDIDAFMKIQEYVVLNVDRAKTMMGNLKELSQSDKKVGKEEALKVMRQVASVKRILDGVNGGGTLVKQTSSLLREVTGDEDIQQRKKDILVDLQNAMLDAELLEQDYIKVAIPLAADSLLNYGTEEVNVELDNVIEATKKTRSIAGIDKRDPEYSLIRVKEGRGELNPEEAIDALVDLKIQQLSNKKLGRKELIQEMTNAHVDKSSYSFYMDPLVYSSEQNLQLFALALNDQITKANEQSRKTIFQFQKVYDTFRAFKGGGFNVEQFNGEFLEENSYKDKNILYLVQPYDVQRFYQDRANAEKSFQENNGWPKDENGKFVERRSDEFQAWAYSGKPTKDGKRRGSVEARKYYRDRAAWYAENTQKVENADAIYNEGQQRIRKLLLEINDIADSELASDQDRVAVLRSEVTDLMNEARWNKSNQTYSGKLARPSDKYKNTKYEAIQASPEKKAYYDELVRQYHADQARGTRSNMFVNAWDKFSYQMPAIRKDDVDRAQEQGVFSAVKDQVAESLIIQNTDTEYGEFQQITGEVQKGVPILYTNKVDAKDVSRDIAASILQFHHMTNMFEAKSEAQGLVLTMLDIHENREVLMTDPQTGSRITNKLATAAGISEVYKTGKGKDSNTFKHLQSFVDANFYGMYDIPQYIKGLGDANKLASSLSVLTALNTLSFNTLQAGNQAILDNLMTWEEAWAGQFFSRANWRSAVATYAASGGAVADLGKMAATSKLGQAMVMFDALVITTDGTGKNITGGKAKQAMSKDSFFVLQHAVEHQTSGVRMLALMKAMKGKLRDKNGKVITNEKGEPADLWELLVKDKDGMLMVDPKVANFDHGKFTAKLRSVQKKTNQIKGRFDKSHFQRTALGKIMTLFRNYFQPQLRKRFGHGDGYHVDHEAGAVSRGMYLSFFEFMKNMITRGQFSMSEYSDVDQQNIRRTLFEIAIIGATYAIGAALAGMMDDDDEDSYAVRFFAYQAKRLQTELLQFVNPKEAMRIADSPTATMNLVSKWTGLLDQGANEIGWSLGIVDEKDIFYQRKSGVNEKGDRKIVHKIKRVLPIVDGMMSTMSPEEKIKFLQK